MRFLFELAKEHETIPKAEVLTCLKAEKIHYELIDSNENIVIIDTVYEKKIESLADRLSYTFHIDKFLFSSSIDIKDVKNHSLNNSIKEKGSIAIKYKNRSKNIDSQEIVKILATTYTKNREVTLENPEIEVRALITDSKVYVGLKLFEINRSQFEERKVQFRPFFSPISLHPKLARALVNLTSVKKNETMLDPFCGTGGILLEAGLIGVRVFGSDIESKMIEGCKKTLDHYKIRDYRLFCSDIGDINKFFDSVDAVVTDLPYGKSTTTKGEEMKKLYSRAFENISMVLKKNGRAVIGIPDKDLLSLTSKYFSLVEVHEFRAHRSLTRYFVVFIK
jgi:tRNA (guanine10-N2)-dimethyltransferase